MTVYTLLDFFSSIGGLISILYGVGKVSVELLMYDMFLAHFMKLFIYVKGIRPRKINDIQEPEQDN